MNKMVIGNTDNTMFNVTKGKECLVIKSFWYNGEGWYKLKDIQTEEEFETPDIFWD